jgi:hypothetical protein
MFVLWGGASSIFVGMIWIMALVLVGLFAFIGHLQGAIRGAFALFGAMLGAILALPLAGIMRPVVSFVGFEHPLWLQIFPPVFVFLLVAIIVTIAGISVYQKVSIHFHHKASDVQRLRWERLEERVGLSIGVAQGVFYFILLLIPIYMGSYFTQQVASNEGSFIMRTASKMGAQIRSAKLDRVVAGYDPSPQWYLKGSDIAGLVYHNPLLQGRLWRYPTLLNMAERTEFQALANDLQFNQLLQTRSSFSELIRHPTLHEIVSNAELSSEIGDLLRDDLGDLYEYLRTGESPKYKDAKILGRWLIDLQGTVAEERRKRPGIPAMELNRLRVLLRKSLHGAILIVTPDNRAVLRGPADPTYPEGGTQVLGQGNWQTYGRNYRINFDDPRAETLDVTVQNEDRIVLIRDGISLVFERDVFRVSRD